MHRLTSGILSLVIAVVLAAGCRRAPDDGSYSADVEVSVATGDVSGDMSQNPEPEPEPEPEPDTVLTYSLASVDDAMAYMSSTPYAQAYESGILPAIASDNLDYAEKLLRSHYNYFIIVDKPSMNVVLYDRFGREVKCYKMACSKRYGTKHKRRDNRTPEGFFSAEGVYDSTDWLYTDDDGNTSQVKGQFGPRFIRLKTDVTRQIGIHGTCAPWALGRRTSHGCIRIHNDNILELVDYVSVGMPIIVNPSERDQEVNREEGCDVPSIDIGKVKKPKPKKEPKPDTESAPAAEEVVDTLVKELPQADTLSADTARNH